MRTAKTLKQEPFYIRGVDLFSELCRMYADDRYGYE
jgi:hypothetical protein